MLPAGIVEGLASRSGLRITGDARVTTPSLDWTPAAFVGGARIDWQDAQFAISADPTIRLGTVNATLAADGDRLTGPMTNDGGAFEVRGTLSLTTNGTPVLPSQWRLAAAIGASAHADGRDRPRRQLECRVSGVPP